MSAVGLMIVQNRQIIFVNQWLADILEYSVEDILTWDLDRANQHVNQDDLNLIQKDTTTLFPSMDFRLLSRTGKEYWVRQFSDTIRIGGQIADQMILLNISERVHMEMELRDSVEKYRQLFEYSPMGILTCDRNGKILTSNDRLLTILDSPSHEHTRKLNVFRLPELKKAGFSKNVLDCIQNKVEINEELMYTSKWGKKIYLQYKLVPFLDKEGNTYEVLCNINDITHIKKAQDEIRAKDLLFQKMIDLAPYSIMICSLDGTVKYLNQKIMEYMEIPSFENMGLKDIIQLINISNQDQHVSIDNIQERWEQILTSIKFQDYKTEITIHSANKPTVELLCRLSLIENQVILIFEDMTERKRHELEWLQTQKLESLNILAGGIAHDFNNILVGIVGNISLLQMTENLDAETVSCLQDLEKATIRATGLTNQLLTFSKGGKPIKKEDDLIPLMKQTIQLVTPGSNCKILLHKKEEHLITNIDASQIQQVFNNLIINAMQAMPRGGNIVINMEKCKVPLVDTIPITDLGYGLITIIDVGSGIPKEFANRIFEPYFTTKDTGTGLGLASSYSIVRNHQGHIKFTSELGKGTIFYIYLPLVSETNMTLPVSNTMFPNYKKNALIIDDDEMVCKTIQKMLLKFGIAADIEEDGFSAIEKYKKKLSTENPYELAIIDLTIPGSIGGKETMERLHALDPEIVAIVSSGYSHNPIMANYEDFGFKEVLVKPYNLGEIRVKLKGLFK